MTDREPAPPPGAIVHVVDDDPAIRDSLVFLFASRAIATRAWAGGEEFLAGGPAAGCACVVLDIRLGGISGLETFERLRAAGSRLPVLFLTGHADVPIAVEALKKGAFDFIEKPFDDNALVDRAVEALHSAAAASSVVQRRESIEQMLAGLTLREREVLDHLVRGELNKQIADTLGVSMRTVEVHRARVFEKMGVRNAVELATLLAAFRN
ncbi:response regulator transcription factor [Oharaeibacter diazotrophicus]|uniref:LuxR family two component transcriptional regulator n=1 Tax=Oharaeibacter diazotrophicus TaxID=1920512 RepID=A0A4R6RFT8_9HYPH|nr:response regulator [Oharaeibacter diazotrophicus]TDP85140.1 LuxR family two component transcriptional regulator [Oharaeibacter diazotrophicus]BBE74110.1 transcriptional regulatory protein TdiR [Pleomorphomonas sp. SM30]GLS76202.1 DNA-binding response regulator [Oharaeibacter diazotrophicus]